MKDPDWGGYGYNKFLTKSLTSTDPNYRTSEDFDLGTEDATLKSSKMGGKIIAKTIIIRDKATGLDRGIFGYQKGS